LEKEMSDDIKIAISSESWNRVVRERDEAREERDKLKQLLAADSENVDAYLGVCIERDEAIRQRDETNESSVFSCNFYYEEKLKAERERDEAREKAERYRIEANAMMMQRDEAVESIMIILEENRHLADGDDCTLAKLKSVVPDWK
jgi:hypothetical protein